MRNTIKNQNLYALIIIDMVYDLVYGVLKNEKNASKIILPIQNMIEYARQSYKWIIVYSNDLHKKQDRELAIWGEHAMEGTKGAKVIKDFQVKLSDTEWEEPKSFYGAFDCTNLASRLSIKGIKRVFLAGQHTNCCVRHSAYGAFINGFDISILKDCVCTFGDDNKQQEYLQYLKDIYGSEIISSKEVITNHK